MDTGNERQQADGYLNDLRLADALVTVWSITLACQRIYSLRLGA
jgi:hypothetical protein